MAAAMALALATICFWYSVKDGSMASFKHTAFAAMVCTSGPPCVPGKVSRSSSLAKAALQSTKPARGPRRVLCVVVDALVFFAHAVGHELVHTAGKIQRMSVGQVTAMRKVHAQHSVSRLERGHVDGHVCGSTRMGLYIGVFCAKQFFGAVNRQLLDLVGEFAGAVITLSRIALCVLVRKDWPHG